MIRFLLLASLVLGLSSNSIACITPPDSVITTIMVDTANCELFIEVTNLRLMGGTPNEFCSCGINGLLSALGDVSYVVFVDSVTNEPILGFDQFAFNQFASSAWDDAASGPDWNGFVSDVNSAGLLDQQAVKLWIKFDVYDTVIIDGFEADFCEDPYSFEEFFYSAAYGTDEWDDSNNSLSGSHQSIIFIYNYPTTFIIVEEGFFIPFDDIVSSFYTGISELDNTEFTLYPNPAYNVVHLQYPKAYPLGSVNIYSIAGELVSTTEIIEDNAVDVSNLEQGTYMIEFVSESVKSQSKMFQIIR